MGGESAVPAAGIPAAMCLSILAALTSNRSAASLKPVGKARSIAFEPVPAPASRHAPGRPHWNNPASAWPAHHARLCAGCHDARPVAGRARPEIAVRVFPIERIGTDPNTAANFASRRFDPRAVGFETAEFPGGLRFDASLAGNRNTGHSFGGPPGTLGLLGPELTDTQRWELIEYLKTR